MYILLLFLFFIIIFFGLPSFVNHVFFKDSTFISRKVDPLSHWFSYKLLIYFKDKYDIFSIHSHAISFQNYSENELSFFNIEVNLRFFSHNVFPIIWFILQIPFRPSCLFLNFSYEFPSNLASWFYLSSYFLSYSTASL